MPVEIYEPTPNSIRLLLRQLGVTTRRVAARLRRQGCRGVPRCEGWCPVAVYLTKHLALYRWAIRVNTRVLLYGFRGGQIPDYEIIYLPEPVRAFIERFDAGKYPSLIGDL